MNQLTSTVKNAILVLALNVFLSYRLTAKTTIFIQTFITLRSLYGMSLFKVHILKKPAIDELSRPWSEAGVV